MIEVRTQAELDAALKAGDLHSLIICIGNGSFAVSGSAQVTAYGSAQVTASKYVAVTRQAKTVKVDGGALIDLPAITTAQEWCDFYDVKVKEGVATLFKAVDDDYSTDKIEPKKGGAS